MGLLVTFDWNCILSIESGGREAAKVRSLIKAHRDELLEVGLLATSASENMRGSRELPGSFSHFEQRVAKLGLSDLPIVRMPAVWGLTYWGHSYWVDREVYEDLSNRIWQIVAPSLKNYVNNWSTSKGRKPTDVEFQGREFAKYRNAWCDVHSAYCHIAEARDFFITSNTKDFPPNGGTLAKIGLTALTPELAAEKLL